MFMIRWGDANVAGGIATTPRPNVLSSGIPIASFMSPVTPHPCCGGPHPACTIHCVATIAPSVSTVLAGGLPVHKAGNVDTCAHPRAIGHFRVLVMK